MAIVDSIRTFLEPRNKGSDNSSGLIFFIFCTAYTDRLDQNRRWNDSGYGVCSDGWAGIKCLKGQVIAIQLPWRGLGGRISEKIGQLQALRKLSLQDNVLGGPVPRSLGFLPNLRGIYLFNNRLSVSIPPSVNNAGKTGAIVDEDDLKALGIDPAAWVQLSPVGARIVIVSSLRSELREFIRNHKEPAPKLMQG
ncbi:hypothetical protein CCACVL1_18392 [Corchorus capsularis]|uniref:Leucine-rich repeat-containing N-terminal plant-type domain-containing protein n=1 Tax=Corchorus capsularis TaxID=210143 RepID=A0A1R3HL81_COCAP|nr:hypothetical protein CCACVL1_18392 [Corchorus capsularis]